jgi:hypothetical protein
MDDGSPIDGDSYDQYGRYRGNPQADTGDPYGAGAETRDEEIRDAEKQLETVEPTTPPGTRDGQGNRLHGNATRKGTFTME